MIKRVAYSLSVCLLVFTYLCTPSYNSVRPDYCTKTSDQGPETLYRRPIQILIAKAPSWGRSDELHSFRVVVVLRSPIHANEPSEYNGMLYRTSNRVLNNGIKVIILICMDGTSQYHHHLFPQVMLFVRHA